MGNAGNVHRFAFGSFRFDGTTGELRGPHRSVKLRPQASQALELLLSRRGEVVSREELRRVLWPDERVVLFEGSIAAVIRELRRALGDDSKAPRFIETVPKRGYRFVSRGTELAGAGVAEVVDVAPVRVAATKKARRGGLLRASGGLAMALMVLPIGGATHFPAHLQGTADGNAVTVAVLPFENLTGQPAHTVLAETLPRELVGWLGAMAPDRLHVVDRIGTAAPGDRPPPDYTIIGSLREDGDATVISARLLSGTGGRFAWGEHYRGGSSDSGLTARAVSARIADAVAASVLPPWQNGSAAVTANEAAADAFRRGTEALAQLNQEQAVEAVDAFRQATELDPGFAAAHAHLAEALISWLGPTVTHERVERARRAASTSIELLPTNATGHRVLGEIGLFYDRDWEMAGDYLDRAIRLSPSDASGHHSYAAWLSARGRHGEALREIDLAAALDPASVAISIDVMFLRYYARDFEGTVSAARRLEQLWPGSTASHRFVVLSRLATGDVAAAAAEARVALAKWNPPGGEGRSAARLSDSETLRTYWTVSADRIARWVSEDSGDPTALASTYVQLGRFAEASDALETAVASRRFSYFLPYLGVSPALDPLCGQPRFESVLRRLRQSALGGNAELPRCAATIAKKTAERRSKPAPR